MRFQGRLTGWNDAKGIGTITWNGGSDRVFVHISAFTVRDRRPAEGDIVTYEVEKDKSGKFRAIQVSFPKSQSGDALTKRSNSGGGLFVGGIMAVFIGYLLFGLFVDWISSAVVGIYAVASLVSFVAYCLDKNAAERGKSRTPESTLHMMALLCGWPGAYAAQRMIRHKTVKQPFQSVFVATVILNIAGLAVYSVPMFAPGP